jgi:hypothetical protein
MSDAQGVSAQSDTTPAVANPSATPEARRARSGWFIRVLATLGALVFAYAAWIPWAIVTTTVAGKSSVPTLIDPNGAFASRLVHFGSFTPSPFVVAAFSMLGLLLAPLLWRPADSLLGAIASHVFGLWLIFATVDIVAFGLSPLVSGKPQPLPFPMANVGATDATITGALALGFWLAVVSLVPLWIAVIGLLMSEWRRHAFWHLPGNDADAPRSLIQLPGASVLNLGLIVWAYGFLAAGWASVNCTQTPLFFSSCQGTPASGAVFAGISQATANLVVSSATDPNILLALDPTIARDALGILMLGGAVLIFLGVWLRAVTRVFCVWTTLWLLAAVALVGVATAGVAAIVARPTLYGFPAGVWKGESGVAITLVGLVLAIIGLMTLIFAALRRTDE